MRARFVNEHLNFEKKKDSLSSLNVGKIHLIKSWLDEMGVKDYTINPDLTIDVYGTVNLSYKKLDKFPSYIKFNHINDNFYCHNNQLISLKGCPNEILGTFTCENNQLINLEGCPKFVRGDFMCYGNKIEFTIKNIREHCDVRPSRIINKKDGNTLW
jgi:hypothetical protein